MSPVGDVAGVALLSCVRAQKMSCLGQWDAVLTCFFIDTAQNIVTYIETIATLLREGGVWINLGPLLYHFEVRRCAS